MYGIVDGGDPLILYIRKTLDLMIELVSDQGMEQYDMGFSRFFDLLLQKSLTNYASQRQIVAKIVRSTNRLPIVIDAQTILIPLAGIRSDQSLFINLEAVVNIKKKEKAAVVYFRSGFEFEIPSHASFQSGIAKVRVLKAWLQQGKIRQENAYMFEKGG